MSKEDQLNALEGSLKGIALTSILQMLAFEKQDATVEVFSETKEGVLYLEQGELVDAETGDSDGVIAAYSMFRWKSPFIQFKPAQARPRKIHIPLTRILLEVSWQKDEKIAEPLAQAEAGKASESSSDGLVVSLITQIVAQVEHVTFCAIIDDQGKILAQSSRLPLVDEPLRYSVLADKAFRGLLMENVFKYSEIISSKGECLLTFPMGNNYIVLYLKKAVSPSEILAQISPLLPEGV